MFSVEPLLAKFAHFGPSGVTCSLGIIRASASAQPAGRARAGRCSLFPKVAEPLAVSLLRTLQPAFRCFPSPLGPSRLSPASTALIAAVKLLLPRWPGVGRGHPTAAGRGSLPGHWAAVPWQLVLPRSQGTAVCPGCGVRWLGNELVATAGHLHLWLGWGSGAWFLPLL